MGQGTAEVDFGTRTRELEREIQRTEAEMSDTIHDIEDRLSPTALKRKAVEKMKAVAAAGMEKVKEQNPQRLAVQAAAAVGAGIGIMLIRKALKGRKSPAAEPAQAPVGEKGRKGIGYGVAGLALGAAMACLFPSSAAGGTRRPVTR